MAGDTATLAAPSLHRSLTLDDFLDSRSAGFDLVRLVMAFLVLVSHTWPLGGFGSEPESPLSPKVLTLGGFAVGGFFALSGLLVGRSALKRRPGAFAKARFARLMPALWMAILVSAFVVGLIGWAHRHHDVSAYWTLRPDGPLAYVGRGATLPVSFSHGIADVFTTDTPYGIATGKSFVNGSLWTLPYEIRCYVVIGLVAIVARRFGNRRTITVAWLLSLALAAGYAKRVDLTVFVAGPYADRQLAAFLFVFLTGTLVAAWAHRINVFGWIPLAALILAVIAGRSSPFWSEHVTQAAMALVLPPVAALLAPLARVLRGVDLSYGLYLYSWPMQQLVALYHWASRPATFIAVSTALAAACAAGSWFAVERPSMAWLRRR
ncbi:MAG: acyltransferase [Actinomycetota bacterium]|nr:acyltransferase [Actinomycetota bacterium]